MTPNEFEALDRDACDAIAAALSALAADDYAGAQAVASQINPPDMVRALTFLLYSLLKKMGMGTVDVMVQALSAAGHGLSLPEISQLLAERFGDDQQQ